MLTNAGYAVHFVGTQTGNARLSSPEAHHEGHYGYRIDHIDGGFMAWANSVPDPDIILLLIGVNDFAQNQDLDHVTNRMDHLITRIVSNRPTAKLVVASLYLRTDYPDINQIVQTKYDPFVPGIVARHAARGEQVYFLDLHSLMEASDLSDGLHPNQVGYAKLAAQWFNTITNLVTPWGTTNAPVVAHLTPAAAGDEVVVSFSKPVTADAADVANYSLSDGLTISKATLDPERQRDVTLFTSAQIPSHPYVLRVSNVCDQSPEHRRIAAGSTMAFCAAPTTGAINNVPESTNYTLVYSLNIPNHAAFDVTGVPYDVDNHYAVHQFSRVAYYLELQADHGPLNYVWVSMDAFTDDAAKIGVPASGSGAFFQQYVTNLNVFSSVRGLVSGTGLAGGYLEFWPSAYLPDNAARIPNASSLLYDFGDQPTTGEFGSMQVHCVPAAETLFALNHWANNAGNVIDLGIGNSPSSNPDWTYAANAAHYTRKILQVFVLPRAEANRPRSP
jgi:hypothetical protein